MKTMLLFPLVSLFLLAFSACGDDSSSPSVPESSNSQEVVSSDDPNEIFSLRKPTSKKFSYKDYSGEMVEDDFDQQDWVCTFNYNGEEGYFYIQSTPVDVEILMYAMPILETDKAELVVGGKRIKVTDAKYDWGGNHHNDKITFTYGGKIFSYYHSSFGWGWRSCQEMDCMNVYDANGEVVKEGCTSKRELPAVCRKVDEKGKTESFKDTFAKCAGDED